MYEYKTIAVRDSLVDLNTLYSEGWEFVNAIPEIISTSSGSPTRAGFVYFTLRKLKQ